MEAGGTIGDIIRGKRQGSIGEQIEGGTQYQIGDCIKKNEGTEYWLESVVESVCVTEQHMASLLHEARQIIAISTR